MTKMAAPIDYPYEASDEASESELLDRSLSMWRGWGPLEDETTFDPIPLDLFTAASIGQYDSVSALIVSGEVDINRKNKGSWTPLMYASYIGHDNIVNLLLDAGADVGVKSDKGTTALMLTASCGNESVAYFLIQQGAEIESRDNKGWTTLFYATFAGHQKMVQFLLETGADVNAREPRHKITPLMMAAAEGHEIIVNAFLETEDGIDVNAKSLHGETARSLALINGHMKIVSLIDSRCLSPGSLRSEAGLGELGGDADLSSSDENYHRPNRPHGRPSRSKVKGPSLRDGPEAIAKLIGERKAAKPQGPATLSSPIVPKIGYASFHGGCKDGPGGTVSGRDSSSSVSSAGHEVHTANKDDAWQDDHHRSKTDQAEDNAFCVTGALTIKSCGSSFNSSTGGPAGILNLSRENSLSSIEDHAGCKSHRSPSESPKSERREVKFSPDIVERVESPVQIQPTGPGRGFDRNYGITAARPHVTENAGKATQPGVPLYNSDIGYHPSVAPLSQDLGLDNLVDVVERPRVYPFTDLKTLLESLNLEKYYAKFEEQDVDLRVFLTLTDADLKEVGIKLLGPRRKMTNAIARWHSQARPLSDNLEQAYADRMETAMQEMAEQLSECNFKNEQLEQKVLQERELRSVVEGCLMEDRRMYTQLHSLVSETRQMCHNMRKIYDTVRSCQAEIISRIDKQEAKDSSKSTSELGLENLARNLHSQLHLDAILTNNETSQPIGVAVPTSTPGHVTLKDHLSLATSPPASGDGDLSQMTLKDLMSMLSQYSHQLGRSVAMATNNMDQLIDGQNPGFSPNSSGNSLP